MEANTDLVQRAREFAIKAHGGQLYGSQPYSVHLEAVAANCREQISQLPFFADAEAVEAAAWCHDVLEDTAVTRDELSEATSSTVADAVVCLTNVGDWHATVGNIASNTIARLVKLADRAANTEKSFGKEDAKALRVWAKYVEQWPLLAASIPQEEFPLLWNRLDAFYSGAGSK